MNRLIAALDRHRGIGKHGGIPWSIPEDEQFFTSSTKTYGGNVLTGARTFTETYHNGPLEGRHNFILSRRDIEAPGATLIHDLNELLNEFKDKDLWIAGGAAVFESVMAASAADELYLTHIDADFGCDRFFPEHEKDFQLVEKGDLREQNGFIFYYAKYTKKS